MLLRCYYYWELELAMWMVQCEFNENIEQDIHDTYKTSAAREVPRESGFICRT